MSEVHGGRYAVVNGVPQVRNWQISDAGSLAAFVNSATGQGTGRRKAVTSWGGNYNCHGGVPDAMPSEIFSFLGYTAPDSDVEGTVGQTYSGDAIVDAVAINWDWASGNVLEHALSFSGHLALTATSSDTAITDATFADPERSGLTKITTSPDGITFTELLNLTQASLQITAGNSSYVNSSTAQGTGRVPGPIDWTVAINMESNLLGSGLVKGNDYIIRMYTTATLFWELQWGMVKDFTNLVVDRETGKVISHTINIEMDAVKAAAGALGYIKKPDASTWWPF